jgi:hypothetical protein
MKLESGIFLTDTRECEHATELCNYLSAMEKCPEKYTIISIVPIPNDERSSK